MSNVEYVGRVFNAGKRSAASARSPGEDGPARALYRASSPRPVIRGESVRAQGPHDAGSGAPLPAAGFVRLPAILAVLPVSRSRWWAGVKLGTYPAAVKLGRRTTAWRVEDIRALLARLAGEDRSGAVREGSGGINGGIEAKRTAARGRLPYESGRPVR